MRTQNLIEEPTEKTENRDTPSFSVGSTDSRHQVITTRVHEQKQLPSVSANSVKVPIPERDCSISLSSDIPTS